MPTQGANPQHTDVCEDFAINYYAKSTTQNIFLADCGGNFTPTQDEKPQHTDVCEDFAINYYEKSTTQNIFLADCGGNFAPTRGANPQFTEVNEDFASEVRCVPSFFFVVLWRNFYADTRSKSAVY